MKHNTKQFRSLLQKALQRGGECDIRKPLPLDYLLKRVHLKSISCHHMMLIDCLCRSIDKDTDPSMALKALLKIRNDCNAAMEGFNETIDYENLENN